MTPLRRVEPPACDGRGSAGETTMTAPPRTTEVSATEVRDYRTPESLPRPGGRLTKEDLDPLVKDAGEGNPAAIHTLLKMIEPVVVRYCRARMGGRDLSYLSADDVAQEVCLAVLKALPDYQDRGGSFLYLVHAIAANKVADAYRLVSGIAPIPWPSCRNARSGTTSRKSTSSTSTSAPG